MVEAWMPIVDQVHQAQTHWLQWNCLTQDHTEAIYPSFASIDPKWNNLENEGQNEASNHVDEWYKLQCALRVGKRKRYQIGKKDVRWAEDSEQLSHLPYLALEPG